jgi:hypothetical protein
MIIKSIIWYAIVIVMTLIVIFYIDFGKYNFICDTIIVTLWILLYIIIIFKITIYSLKNNFSIKLIAKNTFPISSFTALVFWIIIVNAEINHFMVLGFRQLVFLLLSLMVYILFIFGIGMIISLIIRSYYKNSTP